MSANNCGTLEIITVSTATRASNLARAELEIALRVLFERIPDLRAAVDVDDLPFKYGAPIFGLAAFPVTWAGAVTAG